MKIPKISEVREKAIKHKEIRLQEAIDEVMNCMSQYCDGTFELRYEIASREDVLLKLKQAGYHIFSTKLKSITGAQMYISTAPSKIESSIEWKPEK